LQDHAGNIWLGSEGGINLLLRSSDTTRNYHYRQFTKEDGLKGDVQLVNSALIDRHHLGWWANSFGGVQVINTDQFKISDVAPLPRLKGVDINENFLDYRNASDGLLNGIDFDSIANFENYPLGLSLSHKQNSLTFYFSAIDWSAPHKVRYSFNMKGLNDIWRSLLLRPRQYSGVCLMAGIPSW
jgi:hypothetical protein